VCVCFCDWYSSCVCLAICLCGVIARPGRWRIQDMKPHPFPRGIPLHSPSFSLYLTSTPLPLTYTSHLNPATGSGGALRKLPVGVRRLIFRPFDSENMPDDNRFVQPMICRLTARKYYSKTKKSAQMSSKHCALAVVRRSQKFSPRRRPPSRGRGTVKI